MLGGDGKSDKPRNFWDFFVVALIGIAYIPFILGNIVLLYNRKYRPIKTKSVYLTVLSSVGGLIWVLATIVVNNHLGTKKHSIWAVCSLWTFWLQTCFGFSLWLNCMNVRLMVLYFIFVKRKGAQSFKSNLIKLLGLLLPSIIFCTCASVKQPIKFIIDPPWPPGSPPGTEGNCKFVDNLWVLGMLSLQILHFLIFLVLAFRLRSKAMAQYNEFRIIRNGGVMQLFIVLLAMVVVQTQAYKKVIGRSFVSLSVASAVCYYFWARNGEVIYNVIFHKEEYERKFNDDMNRCPSERDITENFPPSFQNLETQLKGARELLNNHDYHIKQLEEEISTMEDNIIYLQEQRKKKTPERTPDSDCEEPDLSADETSDEETESREEKYLMEVIRREQKIGQLEKELDMTKKELAETTRRLEHCQDNLLSRVTLKSLEAPQPPKRDRI